MYETIESPRGVTYHLVPDSDLDHMKDHMIGMIQQLYQSTSVDKEKLEFSLEEVAYCLGIRIPKTEMNI